MVAAVAGLAALLYTRSVAFSVLKYLGVGYLLFLANHVINRPRVISWMRRVFAGSYAVLAGRLALSDR
jgi:threonine/homoserine/homoserine lactone efflux protein